MSYVKRCALFALEDILGGHSAVSNIALRALIDLGTRPATQVNFQKSFRIGRFFKLQKISKERVSQAEMKQTRLLQSKKFRQLFGGMFWMVWMDANFHWRISPVCQGEHLCRVVYIAC